MENNLIMKSEITSLELLAEINKFRKEEGIKKELGHNDLLKVIRDEFSEEINEGKISLVEYKDKKGEKRPMFILTLNQAKQVLLRESKYVRRAIIAYIEVLEQAILDKAKSEWLLTRQQGKLVRREETDAIQELIEYAKRQGSEHSDKLYMTYSKLVNSLVGIKANSRDKVDFEILMIIRQLEDMFTRVITSSMENEIHYKEIYQICKKQGTQFIEIVNGNVKSLGYVN